MQLLNIQDNKANLHAQSNLINASIALRALARDGHTVLSIDVNGQRPLIVIEPPLNGNEPLHAWTSIRGNQYCTQAQIHSNRRHIADVQWAGHTH